MRNFTRITLTAGAVAGLVLVGTLPANAADTTATVEVSGGGLAMSAPESITLTEAAPGETATGTLTGISVTDTRAGTDGWIASLASGDFESGDMVIPLANVTYVPAEAEVLGTAVVAESTATAATGAVQTATGVIGNNTATWSAALSVLVPTDALAATDYTAILTHSVL